MIVENLADVFGVIVGLLNTVIPVIIGLAILFFLWGLVQYLTKTNDETGRQEARNIMIWGIIIIFVMVSVWGLVNVLRGTFILNNNPPILPQIQDGTSDDPFTNTGPF